MRLLIFLSLAALTLYALAAAGLFALQRQLMYFPSATMPPPDATGLTGIEVTALPTPDGETLTAWVSAPQPGAPTLLYLHGNAGDLSIRAPRLAAYQRAGLGALFLSWRGFPGSTGSPSEAGLLTDAQTAYDWLRTQGTPGSQIVVVGESLGTGPAVHLAARNEVAALLLAAPYTATVDVAARRFPWLPVRHLMKDQFRSIDHIGAVHAPILIQHGTEDRVIPHAQGAALAAAATAPTRFQSWPGKGHDLTLDPAATALEIPFLRRLATP